MRTPTYIGAVVCGLWLWCPNGAVAVDRYLATTGNDAHTCVQAQSPSTPKLTFASIKACMAPGDTTYIASGTYAPQSWSLVGLAGSSANRYRFIGSGTAPVFQPQSTATVCRSIITSSTTNGVWIENIVFDASAVCSHTAGIAYIGNRIENASNVTLKNVHVNAFPANAFYVINSNNIVWDGGSWHDSPSDCTTGWRWYGVYLRSGNNNITVQNMDIYNQPGGAMQIYPGSNANITVKKNLMHNNGYCTTTSHGGIVVQTDGSATGPISNVVIARNLIYANGAGFATSGGANGIRISGVSGVKILNNIIYDNHVNSVDGTGGHGIVLQGTVANTVIQNNIITDNEGSEVSLGTATGTVLTHNACTSSESCGTTGKVTLASILSCTPSTTDFTHKAGSACIDAGTATGEAYNGTAPDIGAFETFMFSYCEVPNGAASTIQVTFTSNLNLLGSTLTTFTARRNGSNNALTGAATKIGDTIVSLPLTTTYGAGDSADWSWASGGFSDHAQIGGTLNQPFLPVTNVACANNAGGAPTYSLTQAAFQYRGVYGPENTTDIRGPENLASYEVVVNGAARVRIAVTNAVSNAPSVGLVLRYARNGGAYTVMPGSFGADGIAMCANRYPAIGVVSGTPTTSQLSTGGTFVPGAVVLEALAIPTITGLNVGYKTELEDCVTWDETASGTYTFRLYEQSGAALGTYAQTPSVVIVPPLGGGMF